MVMRYLFDKDSATACVYEGDVPASTITGTVTSQQTPATYMDMINSLTTSSSSLTFYSKYFAVYSSPYSGAFDLLETQYIPRPCATRSVNMTQMDYFYGQWSKTYDMRAENKDKVYAMMDAESEFIY